MRDSVPSASYSSVCNVLRQWNISLIPTYRVYLHYDNNIESVDSISRDEQDVNGTSRSSLLIESIDTMIIS